MRFKFIEAEKATYPIRLMCRLLEVTPSGFYAWRNRRESEHAIRDRQLAVKVRASHKASRGTYGSPRVFKDLRDDGEKVSKKRVARLMRENELTGQAPKRFRRSFIAGRTWDPTFQPGQSFDEHRIARRLIGSPIANSAPGGAAVSFKSPLSAPVR